jgi:hypothetical protein
VSNFNGILSLTEEQYRGSEAVSKSDLDWICPPRTPAHYHAKKSGLLTSEQTPAMRIGSMVHRAVLEPETLAGAWVVKPQGMNFATKEGKEWKAAQTVPIIAPEEDEMIRGIRDSVWAHPIAKRVLKGAKTEVCLFAQDNDGTLRKGRLDALPAAGNAILDLKTTASADPSEFEKSIAKYRYHVQAAYYLDLCQMLGLEKTQFIFVCVEKDAPYAVGVYAIDPQAIEFGRREYQRDLRLIRTCEAEGRWPSFGDEVTTVGLPAWMQKQLEAVL